MAKSKKSKKSKSTKKDAAEKRLETAGKFIREKIQKYVADGGELRRQTWGVEIESLTKQIKGEYGDIEEIEYDLAVVEEEDAKCGLGALLYVTELTPKQREAVLDTGDYTVEYLSAVATGLTRDEVDEFVRGFDQGKTDTPAAKLGHEIAMEFLGTPRECPNCGDTF